MKEDSLTETVTERETPKWEAEELTDSPLGVILLVIPEDSIFWSF